MKGLEFARDNINIKDKLQDGDWRKQPIWPLVRNESRDDFLLREQRESNPENYIVEIFPKIDIGRPNPNKTYQNIVQNILRGNAISGIIDLRLNDQAKYTIWLGQNHMELMSQAAQIPDDPNVRQYLISIKVVGNTEGKGIHVVEESVGTSCDRTPQQIAKVIDAVDLALKNNFIK